MNTTIPTLIDGVERHADFPSIYSVPTVPEKEAIQIGDWVRLGLRAPGRMEDYLWVQLVQVSSFSADAILHTIAFGIAFKFKYTHVLAIRHQGDRS